MTKPFHTAELNARIGVDCPNLNEEEQIHWILNYCRAMTQELAELTEIRRVQPVVVPRRIPVGLEVGHHPIDSIYFGNHGFGIQLFLRLVLQGMVQKLGETADRT